MTGDSEETAAKGGRRADLTDPVDEMDDESFPASDPPSGWAGQDPRDAAPAADGDEAPPA
jgi:hypothetical protein